MYLIIDNRQNISYLASDRVVEFPVIADAEAQAYAAAAAVIKLHWEASYRADKVGENSWAASLAVVHDMAASFETELAEAGSSSVAVAVHYQKRSW